MQTVLLEDGRTLLEKDHSEEILMAEPDVDSKKKAFNELSEYHSSKDLLIAEIEKSKRMIILLISLLISLSIVFIGLLIK